MIFGTTKTEVVEAVLPCRLKSFISTAPWFTFARGDGYAQLRRLEQAQVQSLLTDFQHGWIAEDIIRRGGRWRDMPTSALSFHRDVASLAFPIPEASFRGSADGYLFTLMPLMAPVSGINRALAEYRVHGSNLLGTGVSRLRSEVASTRQQVESTNARLRELGYHGISLSVEDNLSYRQKTFLLALMEGASRLNSITEHWRVCRMIALDDILARTQKAITILALTVALIVPHRLRGHWLDLTYGYNSTKRRVRQLMDISSNYSLALARLRKVIRKRFI